MITYTFILKDPNSQTSPVFLAIRDSGRRLKISTGLTVQTDAWDKDNFQMTRKSPFHKTENAVLLRWKNAAETAVREAELDNTSLEKTKDRILAALGKEVKNTQSSGKELFLPYFDRWATTDTTRRKATNQSAQSSRLFREFLEGRNPTFDEITVSLLNRYVEWMATVRNLKPNTRGGHIKNIKAAMNKAFDEGLHNNTDFRKVRRETEEVFNIYLTDAEVEKLASMSLTGTKEKVRDLFLIGCYTSMRFSDYSILKPEAISDGYIRYVQKKTGESVVLPCHPRVAEIVCRYNGVPGISQQKFNDIIKGICMEAGINEKIPVKETKGLTTTVTYREKWELVTSHTARRTAATNMYKAGIPAISIMKITGHRTEANFMRYIKLSKEENAEMLKGSSFFKY